MNRWLNSLWEFAWDLLMEPRKGSLIPTPVDVEPEPAPNDLLNYGSCKCMDCVCGFNKTDPNYRPGRGTE